MNGRTVPGALRGPLGMGRRLAALISLAASAAFLFAAPPAGAVAPDAGSIIGNQASATYDDGTGIKTATSNTVQTTVAQVASFTLVASQSSTAAPGQTVNFPHTLTNTGNGTDTFDLSATDTFGGGFNFTSVTLYADANCDGVPDNATPITGTGALARNGQFCFIAAAVVPGSAAAGSSDQMTVTGQGNAAAAVGYTAAAAATNTDVVTVTNNANIITTKALSVTSGPSPNTNITVTLTYTNTGAATATNVTLTDLIGSGATAGMSYVPASGLWSGGSPLTDPAAGDAAGINYDFGVTPNTVTAVILSVLPGQSGTLSFRVNINAGLPPGSATTQNTAYLCYNNGAALVPAACTGSPGNSQPTNTVAYTVLGSFAVDATDVSATPVAISSTDDDATTNDIVRDAAAAQGSTVVFDNVIVNDGNGTDTFNITLPVSTFPAGTSFQLFNSTDSAPLTDSNADAIPDTGPLGAGTATHVFVHVVLPPSATGGPFDVTKRATSVGGGVFDEVTDRLLAITTSSVDLTNNSAGGLGVGPGPEVLPQVTNTVSPGATTTFTLFVNNTSTSFDNYDLAASTDSSFASITLPAGWSASFRQATGGVGSECSLTGAVITNTGSIAGGASRAVCALVSVPAAAPAGNTEVFFRARSPNTLAEDRKHDRVTVNTVNQLTLIPNNVNQVFPGGNVVYQHTLTNTGNVTETVIAFPAASNTDTLSGSGWNHVLYLDDGDNVFEPGTDDTVITPGSTTIASLAAGAGVNIWDNVFAPLGATVGTTNITTITAQSGSSAANGSATDSTTVISSDLTLLKEQSQVDCGTGALIGAGFVTTPLSGVNAVPPGGCLKYRITGTNSGTTGLTSLSISDSTPGFTFLETTPLGCPVAATTTDAGAPATGGTAVDEGTGTVTATKASLAPLTNVVLTYCVQIDQ